MAKLLLKFGADPNIVDEDGRSPLMMATNLGSTKMVEILIKAGAHINQQKTNDGNTALIIAAK